MNKFDKDRLKEQLDAIRKDVDTAERRQDELMHRRSIVRGLVYGLFIGTCVGLGGGMAAMRGELNIIETVSREPVGQEAHDWLDAAVAAEEKDPFGKDQMTLRCALATPVLAIQGMLLGLWVGAGIGTVRSITRKK